MACRRCWRGFRPEEAAIEQTFVNRDAAATLKLGQARGIALLVPALRGLTIAEYAPNAVKKTVVGAGHADKGQIRAHGRSACCRAPSRQRRCRRRARHRHLPCPFALWRAARSLGRALRGRAMIGKLTGRVDSGTA